MMLFVIAMMLLASPITPRSLLFPPSTALPPWIMIPASLGKFVIVLPLIVVFVMSAPPNEISRMPGPTLVAVDVVLVIVFAVIVTADSTFVLLEFWMSMPEFSGFVIVLFV